MNTPTIITTLALLLSAAPLTLGLPQAETGLATDPKVFHPWSQHADCAAPATACKTDCTEAVKKLCQGNLGLGDQLKANFVNETVGDCTVSYLYQLGNTLPTPESCYNNYAYINDAGTPGPDGCGGTFGGALGGDAQGKRTMDPVYSIMPKGGNPDCFTTLENIQKKPVPVDELPGGTKIPLEQQCSTALSRRDGTLQGRNNAGCIAAPVLIGVSCAAICAVSLV
ncbi:MAG: hypothetical protein Q9169_006890, partial [Polycauliona sp. 2 TL-2023]